MAFETRRRQMIPEVEALKRQQNTAGDEIARAKRQGKDAAPILAASKQRTAQIKQLEIVLESVEHQRLVVLMALPNLPHASVPVGGSAADNQEVRRHGDPPSFDFEPKAHWDLGPGARHPRLRARDEDVGRALRGAPRRRRAALARAHQLHARPAHARARLHRGRAAVPRERRGAHRHGQAAEVRGGPVQGGRRLGPVPRSPPPRCPSRTSTATRSWTAGSCRCATSPTRRASAARPAPTAPTCAA